MSTHAAHADRPGGLRRAALRTSRWIVTLVVVAVMLACAAWIAPSFFGYSRFVITGGSMTGTYDKGSVVFEKKVPVDQLEVGDVITYLPPADSGVSTLVTHRIVGIEPADGGGTLFSTQGDASPRVDPWKFKLLDQEQAVAEFGVPHVGWVFVALADREVRMLVIGLPAALIALVALGQLVSALGGGRRKEARTEDVDPLPVVSIPPQRSAPEQADLLV